MKDEPDEDVLNYLGQPSNFRAAFPKYAQMPDEDIRDYVDTQRHQMYAANPGLLAANPNQEPTYPMTGPDKKTVYQIPYNKVGYALGNDYAASADTLQKFAAYQAADLANPNVPHGQPQLTSWATPEGKQFIGQPQTPYQDIPAFQNLGTRINNWFMNVTQPTPDNPNTTAPANATPQQAIDAAWNAGANALNVGGNIVKSFARGMYGLAGMPAQVYDIATGLMSSDPKVSEEAETQLLAMHPGAQAYDLIKEIDDALRTGTQRKEMVEDIIGKILSMGASGKVIEGVGNVGDTALNTAGKLVGKVPGVRSALQNVSGIGTFVVREGVEAEAAKAAAAAAAVDQANVDAVTATNKYNQAQIDEANARNDTERQAAAQKTADAKVEVDKANQAKVDKISAKNLLDEERYKVNVQRAQEAADRRNLQAGLDAQNTHQQTVAKVEAGNQTAQQKYETDLGVAQEINAQAESVAAERQRLEADHAASSREYNQRIDQAEVNAKAANDAAWDAFRRKTAGAETSPGPIVDAIHNTISSMDPPDVVQFKKILKETPPPPTEVERLKDEVAQGAGAKDYASADKKVQKMADEAVTQMQLDPDATNDYAPVNGNRLHVWKTQLEYAIRKTQGNVQYGIGKVLDTVRDTQNQLAAQAGASPELTTARSLHGPYKDTFVNSPNEPPTVASSLKRDVTPEMVKADSLEKRLGMAGNYDPQIPVLASHIQTVEANLKALKDIKPVALPTPPTPNVAPDYVAPQPKPPNVVNPPNYQTTYQPKPYKPDVQPKLVEPKVTTPEEQGGGQPPYPVQDVDITAIENGLFRKTQVAFNKFNKFTLQRLVSSPIGGLLGAAAGYSVGHPILGGLVGTAATEYAMNRFPHLLETPGFRDYLHRMPGEDVAILQRVDNAPRIQIINSLNQAISQAAAQGNPIKVSPDLALFLAQGAGVGAGNVTRNLQAIRDKHVREMRTPPPVH
jgi:hypothetical protein